MFTTKDKKHDYYKSLTPVISFKFVDGYSMPTLPVPWKIH